MSTPTIDTHCPSSARRFKVEAGYRDPSAQHHHDLEGLDDNEVHIGRAATNRAARAFLQRGLWVEVYDDDTQELLAGPFDPDQPAPAYIV
jgi:hypothetical protein